MTPLLPDGAGVLDRKAPAGKVIRFYVALVGIGALGAVGLLIFLGLVTVGGEARAGAKAQESTLESKVDKLITATGTLQADMKAVKCRLNIENTCPDVRTSGVGR